MNPELFDILTAACIVLLGFLIIKKIKLPKRKNKKDANDK